MRPATFIERARAEGKPAACQIIELPAHDAALYQDVRRLHCADEKGNPDCVGRLTIDARGITLQCVRCGDMRGKNPKDVANG